jgi:HEAT repeat protein
MTRIDPTGDAVLKGVGAMLKDVDETVRFESAEALGNAGTPAREYIPTLERLKDTDPSQEVRRKAASAILQIEHNKDAASK